MVLKEDIIWMLPKDSCRRRKCFSPMESRNRPPHAFREDGTVVGQRNSSPDSPIVFRRVWKTCYGYWYWPSTECREMPRRPAGAG